MTAPSAPSSSKDGTRTREIRGPELGPALKRERLLRRIQAARKRLAPISSNGLARLR